MRPVYRATALPLFIAIFGLASCSKDVEKPTVKPSQTHTGTQPIKTIKKATPVVPNGAKLFTRCRACHTLKQGGKHRVGPNLWNVFGRTSGTSEGYAYSKAMQAAQIVWSEETMSNFLENPSKSLPKTKMAFVGLRKQADREALIQYLKENTQ